MRFVALKPFWDDFRTLWCFLFIQEPETEFFCQNLNWNVRMIFQCDHLLKVSEKVTQKLVLSASKSKAQYSDTNISVDNVPHCVTVFRFAYSTKCAKKKSVFSVKKINVFPPCILLGKDARPPMKSSDRERAFITVGNCNFDHCQSTPKNYHYCLGSTHTAADKQIKRRRKNSGRLFMWYPVFHPKNSYCCEVDVFIPSVGVWNSWTILCSPFSVARTELKGAIKLDPT